jgi:hypothetical protein
MGWYEGDWLLGKYNGKGVRVYSNGSKYVGDFADGTLLPIPLPLSALFAC